MAHQEAPDGQQHLRDAPSVVALTASEYRTIRDATLQQAENELRHLVDRLQLDALGWWS